ncbi:MAG: SGNH/GDSL hydrolase family protein [Halomonadaceae bacterium]|nr:MAG: SGNH/GDSL hydrolase family protein [Halomonadaceae bacterium]
MLYPLATLLLLPVLFIQGRYVRSTALRLPEPDGPRRGRDGKGPRLRLLIAGDSATAGVGVSHQQDALSGQLVSALATDHEVHWALTATTGYTAGELLQRLQTEPPETFDAVLLAVGVNDVTGGTGTTAWQNNLQQLIRLAREKYSARHVFLCSVPPMHLFPALPQPLRWWLGQRARMLNGQLAALATEDHQCSLVTPDFPLEHHYMAEDGFHPSADAYKVWGTQAAAIIGAQLSSGKSV